MKLISLANLDTSLDFQPRTQLDQSLPIFSWSGLQLNGFDRHEGEAVELETGFAKAFFKTHPILSLSELSRLYRRLESITQVSPEDIEELLLLYKVKPSSQNKRLLMLVAKLPTEFQAWCDQKACKPGDLICILSVENLADIKLGLLKIAGNNASLSNGLKALEIYVELVLMGKTADVGDHLVFEKWMKNMTHMRFPLRAQKEETASTKLKKITWPSRVEHKWQSRGDADSLLLKIELKSPTDFAKKLKDLEKCLKEIEQDSPWTV